MSRDRFQVGQRVQIRLPGEADQDAVVVVVRYGDEVAAEFRRLAFPHVATSGPFSDVLHVAGLTCGYVRLRRSTCSTNIWNVEQGLGRTVEVEADPDPGAPTPTEDRLREERNRLRDEVVALRRHVPHDLEEIERDLGQRRAWRCRRCGHKTEAPVHTYFHGCPDPEAPLVLELTEEEAEVVASRMRVDVEQLECDEAHCAESSPDDLPDVEAELRVSRSVLGRLRALGRSL